jgi:hypothetical protein
MDIVADANVMRLYDKPSDPDMQRFFAWLASAGTLAVSSWLLEEYGRTQNRDLAGLIQLLMRAKRLSRIDNPVINAFSDDRHYGYTCNYKDIRHARLVFLSRRKRLVTIDRKLRNDVNGFPKVHKIKPRAVKVPSSEFYSV